MTKNNPLFGIILALGFVILGAYLINRSQNEDNPLYLITGLVCIVFFGCLFFAALVRTVRK